VHAWFVFDRDYCGPAEINFVSINAPDARMPWTDHRTDSEPKAAASAINGARLSLPLPVEPPNPPACPTPAPVAACHEADRRLHHVPLVDLVDGPLVDGKTLCPFHADSTPSCHVYDDHYHCFACGAHGDQVDWLIKTRGLDQAAAIRTLETWDGSTTVPQQRPRLEEKAERTAAALRLWAESQPIAGTLAAVYLSRRRGLELDGLPTDVDATLRFHPHCPFGPGTRHPCLVALMRDPVTDDATGVQRVALAPDGSKIDRRMLGRSGVVKLWPAGTTLVAGEGLETTIAAALSVPYRGALLQPAWAVLSAPALARLPVVAGVRRLVLLVDHDESGAGQAAGMACTERWRRSGVTVIRLTPKRVGTDFNDIIQGAAS
jgi:hypothetical protein